jgi:hypothetical protein
MKECVIRPFLIPDETLSHMPASALSGYYGYLKTYDELCR